ncbi:MAG: hypothetical protein KA151_10470, partial [Piscinibacter sp.]|nr:hypothetical protein [Piscinibacter sp.]
MRERFGQVKAARDASQLRACHFCAGLRARVVDCIQGVDKDTGLVRPAALGKHGGLRLAQRDALGAAGGVSRIDRSQTDERFVGAVVAEAQQAVDLHLKRVRIGGGDRCVRRLVRACRHRACREQHESEHRSCERTTGTRQRVAAKARFVLRSHRHAACASASAANSALRPGPSSSVSATSPVRQAASS